MTPTNSIGNGNGNARRWWYGIAVTGILTWASWITVHVANYVTGEARGERLSTTEAKLMIEIADHHLRVERDAQIAASEVRMNDRIHSMEEQIKLLNERLRLNELKRIP